MKRFVEIRGYNVKPRTRADFHRLVTEQSVPMLRRWEVDVVAFGPSLHDDDSYFLIRAYASLEARQRSQDAFYSSDEWRRGPRQEILDCIDGDTSVVIEMDSVTIEALRRS
ncbi:MAG: NIPSNAP family protein [Actinomycetota bacterium]|nr:NIPSNAP family protein [Actinomycetota bacterium]